MSLSASPSRHGCSSKHPDAAMTNVAVLGSSSNWRQRIIIALLIQWSILPNAVKSNFDPSREKAPR